MRKLSLLAAAAMVAGGSAFAMDGGGVSISGEANFGVKFAESDDDSKNDLQFHHEFKVTFAASGTTDGGIGFGGEMTLDNTESVTSGKVTPAKTGYIVTADDLKEAKTVAALEKKYGISISNSGGDPLGVTLAAGDVIESGVATSLSGYGKATVKGHTNTVVTTNRYGAGVDATGLFARLDAITTDATAGTTANTLTFEEGTTINIGGRTYEVTQAVASGTGLDDGTTPGGDDSVITLTLAAPGSVNTIILTYDANAIPAEGDTPAAAAWVITGNGSIAGSDPIPANANIVTTRTTTSTLDGADKVSVSQAYIDGLSASVAASDKQKVNNHGEVYISMDMHKLTIGSDLDAADKLAGGLADPGFDGIGIDDVAEGPYGGSAADVRYDGDFGVAKVAISYGDNAGDAAWAAGFSFNVEPVNFGAGFDSNGVMSVGMGFTQGAIAMNALYSTDSDHDEADNEAFKCSEATASGKATYNGPQANACWRANYAAGSTAGFTGLGNKPNLKNQAFGVDVSYQMSEATSVVLVAAQHKKESAKVSFNRSEPIPAAQQTSTSGTTTDASYSWTKSSTTVDAFGVGFSHDLGGGATLKAGAGSVDSNAVADLGITMTF